MCSVESMSRRAIISTEVGHRIVMVEASAEIAAIGNKLIGSLFAPCA